MTYRDTHGVTGNRNHKTHFNIMTPKQQAEEIFNKHFEADWTGQAKVHAILEVNSLIEVCLLYEESVTFSGLKRAKIFKEILIELEKL